MYTYWYEFLLKPWKKIVMILRSEFSLYFSYRVKNVFLTNLLETLVNPPSVGSLKACNFGESFWRIFESLELLWILLEHPWKLGTSMNPFGGSLRTWNFKDPWKLGTLVNPFVGFLDRQIVGEYCIGPFFFLYFKKKILIFFCKPFFFF